MHPEELERQRGLGYAPALGNPAPAVITFTSGIATSAVNEFLNRLTGFVLDDAVPSEIMHSYHLRKIIGTLTPPNPDCMCQDRHTWGSGDTRLFLDRTWPIPTESGYAE